MAQPETNEVILVEDQSTDDSYARCQTLANHAKVKLYIHPDHTNRGAGASRNLGIKQAKSKYIAFLDADDYYLAGRFSFAVPTLERHLDVDGVYEATGVHFYSCALKDEWERKANNMITMVETKVSPEELFEKIGPIASNGHFTTDALTVRKEVFSITGLFDTFLELSQDTHMWLRMALKLRLVSGSLTSAVAMRGVHDHNRSTNSQRIQNFRPYMFYSLIQWALRHEVPQARSELLFQHLSHHVQQANISRATARKFYWNSLRQLLSKHPSILFTKRTYSYLRTGFSL